ncbi:MAG: hypothetical protein ACRC6I_04325 [Paracoccaceae bacterium]
MPFLLGLLGLIAAAYFWAMRARNAADMTRDLAGVASDVAAAARRFGFRRRGNTHPVESLDDADVAVAGAGIAFLELGGLPSTEAQDALVRSLQSRLEMAHDKAQEALILGRWLVTESQGAQPGFTRLVRKLMKMKGQAGFEPLMAVLRDVVDAAGGTLSPQQGDALDEVKYIYRL